MTEKSIAVVIGFRDWGLDRLNVAVERLSKSSMGDALDIVVSDYGSRDEEGVRIAVESAGGRVVRTSCGGPWSRSRALNAGVLATSTDFVITTDADMIFTHEAVERILRVLQDDANTIHLVQCRDLDDAFGAETASASTDDILEEHSHFRPRWGMGGLIAFRRADFELLGGYDARMEIYGGEDIDFAQRLSRCGRRINWIDDPAVRIFHIWHPSTREAVQRDPTQLAAQQRNQEIMLHDQTWLRNINIGGRAQPVVSVLIASYNRATYLMDSINSVLAQTVQDFELIVMDDGSTDHTRDVLSSIDDPRVRWSGHENRGVAYTRNRLVSEARSSLVVVHDDDDIMLPWRVEAHLDTLSADLAGTYGGWVDFDNETGQTEVVPGKMYSPEAFMYTGKILAHGTSMFRTDILRRFAYREHLKSGVDFNLIVRIANSGYKLQHTGHLHILRRMHGLNLTTITESHQKKAATRTVALLRRRSSVAEERGLRSAAQTLSESSLAFGDDLERKVLIYLPDHLAKRQAKFSPVGRIAALLHEKFPNRIVQDVGWADNVGAVIHDVTHAELALLRRIEGLKVTVSPPQGAEITGDANASITEIVQALPNSGLLEEGSINRVCIRPITPSSGRQSLRYEFSLTDEHDGSRTRYWSDGNKIFEVSVTYCIDLSDTFEKTAQNGEAIILFFPEQFTYDMVKRG